MFPFRRDAFAPSRGILAASAPLPHPRIELALCFEDVAKNIFNSLRWNDDEVRLSLPLLAEPTPARSAKQQRRKDPFERVGTRPGPSAPSGPPPTPPGPPPFPLRAQGDEAAAVLSADTDLQPATVGAQAFLNEFDLSEDRVTGCRPGRATPTGAFA